MPPAPPDQDPLTTDFRLAESSDGWLLTVAVTPRLIAALTRHGADEGGAEFTVSITPNLVPGTPFQTRLAVTDQAQPELEPPGQPTADGGAPAHTAQRRMFRHRLRVEVADSG